MEQQTSSKLGKGYDESAYSHLAYLAYMHVISCEMMGWMNHKGNQNCWEKYQQPQICR